MGGPDEGTQGLSGQSASQGVNAIGNKPSSPYGGTMAGFMPPDPHHLGE